MGGPRRASVTRLAVLAASTEPFERPAVRVTTAHEAGPTPRGSTISSTWSSSKNGVD
jgi:hypothetical protein